MTNETTSEARLAFLRKSLDMSQKEFAGKLELTQGALSQIENGKTRISIDTLFRICDVFSLSADWILYGRNPMYRSNAIDTAWATPLDKEHTGKSDLIYYVNRQAHADYIKNFHDLEYLKTLEAYRLPGFKEGRFRMFQVSGNSMEPVLFNDEILVVEFVEDIKKLEPGNIFVVMTMEGIVVKRLFFYDRGNKKIVLKSDNPEYKPYKISAGEILEIWEVKAKITKVFLSRINQQGDSSMHQKYDALEKRIKRLEKELLDKDMWKSRE